MRAHALVLATLVLTATARASTVLPLSLEELVQHADRVFVGRAVDVSEGTDPVLKMSVRYTTFEVLRPVKGSMGQRVTIKQLVSFQAGERSLLPGVASFPLLQELVLFLYKESDHGFSSPVGLFQGVLPVKPDAGSGKKFVVGEFNLRRLLHHVKSDWVKFSVLSKSRAVTGVPSERAVDLDQFLGVLDGIVQGR